MSKRLTTVTTIKCPHTFTVCSSCMSVVCLFILERSITLGTILWPLFSIWVYIAVRILGFSVRMFTIAFSTCRFGFTMFYVILTSQSPGGDWMSKFAFFICMNEKFIYARFPLVGPTQKRGSCYIYSFSKWDTCKEETIIGEKRITQIKIKLIIQCLHCYFSNLNEIKLFKYKAFQKQAICVIENL